MTGSKSELALGLRLEDPAVLIPWGASIDEVLGMFRAHGRDEPRKVTASYYTSATRLVGGTRVKVGFHFGRKEAPAGLEQFELFDNGEREIEKSYQLFHRSLVEQFGEPSLQRAGDLGASMPYCEWRAGSVQLVHYVIDRFGPEEHVTLGKTPNVAGLSGAAITTVLVSIALVLLYSWCEHFSRVAMAAPSGGARDRSPLPATCWRRTIRARVNQMDLRTPWFTPSPVSSALNALARRK
jgi:hypothetical protein